MTSPPVRGTVKDAARSLTFPLVWLACTLLLFIGFSLGCSQSTAPPAPLPADQMPAALQKSFAKAKPEAKDLVGQIVSALEAKNYSKLYIDLQTLAAMSGLNKDQQSIASRAVMTANTLLQEAQAKGEPQAAETLKAYLRNK